MRAPPVCYLARRVLARPVTVLGQPVSDPMRRVLVQTAVQWVRPQVQLAAVAEEVARAGARAGVEPRYYRRGATKR
jgi:hypothetical protein